MSEHSKEPWSFDGSDVINADGCVFSANEIKKEDIERIIDCVNACKGMPDIATEIDALRASLLDMIDLAECYESLSQLHSYVTEEGYKEISFDISKAKELLNKETK